VLATIKFDNKPTFPTQKIAYKFAYGHLTAKLVAFQLAATELGPKQAFG
jgi:hypothetical protein